MQPEHQEAEACSVDLSNPGEVSDIVSNALMRGLNLREEQVRAFLDGSNERYPDGETLLAATARHFGLERSTLDAQVQAFLHCNCDHGPLPAAAASPSSPTAGGPPPERKVESGLDSNPWDGLAPILYAIAVLLALLLVLNTATLILLARRTPPAI